MSEHFEMTPPDAAAGLTEAARTRAEVLAAGAPAFPVDPQYSADFAAAAHAGWMASAAEVATHIQAGLDFTGQSATAVESTEAENAANLST